MKIRISILLLLINLNISSIFSQDFFDLSKINFSNCEMENARIENNICECQISNYNFFVKYQYKKQKDILHKDGQYFLYNLDSILILKAEFKLDTLLNFTKYDKYKLEAYEISNGNLNGQFYSYLLSGRISILGNYKDNQRNGEWVFYHKNGNIESKGNYYPNIIKIDVDSSYNNIYLKNNYDSIFESYPFSKTQMELLLEKYNQIKTSFFYFPYIINFKDGIWEYFDINENLIRKEIWDKNILLKTIY